MSQSRNYAVTPARAAVIGEVRAEMGRKGLTPTDLGRITGKGQQYWSRRTTGLTAFDVDDFGTLSAILQVPMSRFMPEFIPDDSSPQSDSNRRPPLYIVDGSPDWEWPLEVAKVKDAA